MIFKQTNFKIAGPTPAIFIFKTLPPLNSKSKSFPQNYSPGAKINFVYYKKNLLILQQINNELWIKFIHFQTQKKLERLR